MQQRGSKLGADGASISRQERSAVVQEHAARHIGGDGVVAQVGRRRPDQALQVGKVDVVGGIKRHSLDWPIWYPIACCARPLCIINRL